MAKSSRHKSSHKQSKHSSKEARDCSSESEEEVKERSAKGGESSVRVSEKRKAGSQSRDGHGGEASEELRVSSKRRKDGVDEQVLKSGASKSSSKSKGESRSRSGRRSENGSDRKEEIVEIVEIVDEKQKDVEVLVVKERECGSDKERRVKEKKVQDGDYVEGRKKPKSRSLESNEKPKQHDLENADLAKEPEKLGKSRGGFVEKGDHLDDKRGDEDGKLSSRREHSKDGRYKEDKHIDGSYKDSHRDYVDKESRHRDDKHKEETDNDGRSKDGRYKEDKHIDGSYKDSHRDYVDRESRHRDDKHKEETDNDGRSKDGRYKEDKHIDGIHKERYRDDIDRESRHRDNKHREETDRDGRHKDKHFDESYKDDGDRDSRHRDSRHKEESDRDVSHKDGKQREDIDKDGRHKDGKQREKCDQNSRQRDGKRRDDFDQDSGHGDGRQGKDLDKDGKHRDCKQREDGSREKKYREDKYREDGGREKRYREDKYREDDDRVKRYREDKYRDEYIFRDHPSDKYDSKRTRDESTYSESRSRKSKCQYAKHDGSPVYIGQDTKYKDDKKTRRFDYNEDESDIRSRKTNEPYSDVGNSMKISKSQIVTDKDIPNSCNTDSRRPSSPNFGSRGQNDKFRHSKRAESKYRDLSPEEKVIHDTNSYVELTGSFAVSEKSSVPHPRERLNGEDYSIKHELSSGRYLAPEVHTSPGQLVNGSTASIVNNVHMVEAGVRQSSDAEEFGQRSKDARDLLGNESKKGLDFPLETPSVDDISQVNRDNFSPPPSPISRTSHLPGNSRPRFHSTPSHRAGKDGPSGFGSFEEGNRGRSNNRYKRSGNSNMGRAQGNAWSGVPNWSSPLTGNFMHFQNGPPSVGFHPMMQQFSGPPMFGVRPFMEFAHSRGPYPIPDANTFSGHGHQFRWPNPVGDSCLPLAHGWDVNNGNDAHMYGRLDWDHNRSSMNPQGHDTGADILKGHSSLATTELPSTIEKEDSSVHAPSDDISASQSIQQSSNDLNELNFQAENGETYQPSDALAKETDKSPNTATAEKHYPSNVSQSVDACYFHAYLSRLDISADLSYPDLYDKCRSVMDMKQSKNTILSSSQFSFIEEVTAARVKISKLSPNSSLFVAINESVYQKAMRIYEKQQEVRRAFLPSLSNGKKHLIYSGNNMDACAVSDLGKAASPISISPEDKLEETKGLPAVMCEESDAPIVANSPMEHPAEPIPSVEVTEMNLDNVVDEENPHCDVEDKVLKIQECASYVPHYMEEDIGIQPASSVTDKDVPDSTPNQLLLSDVPSEACEAVMSECGLVNLTRIYHSTGSTH